MPIPDICLGRGDISGGGGYAGGGGAAGPASGVAGGGGVSGNGYPAIALVTGQKKDIELTLYSDLCGGDIEDLTDVSSAKFVAKETAEAAALYIEKDVMIDPDPTTGLITIPFRPADLPYAGIWVAAVSCYDAAGDLIAEYPAWLEVRKGLNSQERSNTPISIPEIRLVLRDTCPEFNTLLLDLEFSDTEIAFAITRPVDEWNETPPPVQTYTPATFPWREAWRKAVCGSLLQSAAHHYMRNKMQYSAGGTSFNDKNKDNPYLQLAEQLLAEWKKFMAVKKVQLNAQQAFGSVVSGTYNASVYYD